MLFGEQDVLVYQEAVLARRGHRLGCRAHPLSFVRPFPAHSGYYLRLLYGRTRSPAPLPAMTIEECSSPPAGGATRRKPDACVKRSRITTGYELSQDLAERQVACLERRYGGRCARRAATTIQRAYRRHALTKTFRAITSTAKTEKRLSRRFELPDGWPPPPPPAPEPTPAAAAPLPAVRGGASLNCSLENESDLSDREYQSYGYLNESTYIGEYLAPRVDARDASASPRRAAAYQVRSERGRTCEGSGWQAGLAESASPRLGPMDRLCGAAMSASLELDVARNGLDERWAASNNRKRSPFNGRSSSGRRPAARPACEVDGREPAERAGRATQTTSCKVPEIVRKRQYRVGLNLFNTKPERGIDYLIGRGFLDESPHSVARFLITRKGLSKQMIGEYLGDLQSPFNAAVLEAFVQELDFYNMQLDTALRKFQTYFRLPGEAQKIERLMEVFGQRYCQCNHEFVASLKTPDTVFVLAFAIIMLNTDLFTPSIKAERKMKMDDFIKNLRGIDDGADVDPQLLAGVYERVRAHEFRAGADHVTPVLKVQQTIIGKKPPLALPHRRLVCYCRLYEVPDASKKERPGVHQREVFLFNDLMLVTKIFSKKKNAMTYTCRQSLPLAGLSVSAFDLSYYPFGIRLSQRVDGKVLLTFNARNEHDRTKFCEDLRESILEMDEMEALRIDAELERQKASSARGSRSSENRDSGVADVEEVSDGSAKSASGLKRAALSNSLLDMTEAGGRPQRRGSVGSLDSGMSVSFQSNSTASVQAGSPPRPPGALRLP
ncbi:IQ motif and SEC7 domain-containing protein 2-like [Pollicipes pollicipes]|uniref:IQ motif and SEC7 domain-containing protein 2-like n=1 Tax=Pollicipes pollicipes TaxID=41117 RepID=UPI001884B60E|nr:IQ motif and SEC7 domain-containing protein 2-like [Pollicipes pollicipes]